MESPLIEGVERFRRDRYPELRDRYRRLVAEGQRPPTLFICCSDSRVGPERLVDAEPGELFVARNAGAFVPPFDPDSGTPTDPAGPTDAGVGAAIEYAVVVLGVTDIVVCGHTHCGAIRALYEPPDPGEMPVLDRWLQLGREARVRVSRGDPKHAGRGAGTTEAGSADAPGSHPRPPDEELLRRTEEASVALQLERLGTYPAVAERAGRGDLRLHGWHWVIEEGRVRVLDEGRGEFVSIPGE